MTDDQIERLLVELSSTRESFDAAIKKIEWRRINNVILYSLFAMVFVLGALGANDYVADQRRACNRDNRVREAVLEALDIQATNIGAAIAEVSQADAERFAEYLEIIDRHEPPEALLTREC